MTKTLTTSEKIANNIAAIKLLKELTADNKMANADEQSVLEKYVGWGGLANEFFDKYNTRFQKEREELQKLVTSDEYRAMEDSSLTAYYTSEEVAKAMWSHIVADGFKGGNILDPSMGTGVFFKTMPEDIKANSNLVGIELDTITGNIAKHLHQDATIKVQGFESINFDDQPFDLVISNIPFADIRIVDKKYANKSYLIHDYFIKKSLDVVRPEGVVAVISSIGTSDKRTGSILPELKDSTRFLGGVRMPNNTFKNAGTSVTTDILFFQKTDKNIGYDNYFNPVKRSYLDKDNIVFINNYFLKEDYYYKTGKNEQVLGTYTVSHFHGGQLNLVPDLDTPFEEGLATALANLVPADYPIEEPVAITYEEDKAVGKELIDALDIRMNEFAADENGALYYRDNNGVRPASKVAELTYWTTETGQFDHWDSSHKQSLIDAFSKSFSENPDIVINEYRSEQPSQRGKNKGFYKNVYFYETAEEETVYKRIRKLVEIKNAYQAIIDIQADSDYDRDEFAQLLANLNKVYDGFVKKYGFINSPTNARAFERDDRYPLIASLENEVLDEKDTSKVTFEKSAAFVKPLIRPKHTLSKVDCAMDALIASQSEGKGVDLEFMTYLYPGHSKEDIISELEGVIYIDVDDYYLNSTIAYTTKDKLLSGDVKTKAQRVKDMIEVGDSAADWEEYLELIKGVIPEDLVLADISFNLGSNWIPKEVIGLFMYRVLGDYPDFSIDDKEVSQIVVDSAISRGLSERLYNRLFNRPTNIQLGLRSDETTQYNRAHMIVEYLLSSDQPTIKKNVGTASEPKYVINQVDTANLREAERVIQEKFKSFVEEDEELSKLVERTYNDKYNRRVNRQYDGSLLTFDGLANDVELRPHQKNAVQRIIEDKRALLAHEVGTGKTLTMISAAFKMKELGLINKPLFVVPSSLTAQFGQEIMRFYPTKKVFVTTEQDFQKARRRLFISRIVSGDYDGIVIGHSQFEKVKVSEERQIAFYEDQIAKLEETIAYARANDDKVTFKTATAMRKRLEKTMQQLCECKTSKDEFIDFEQLGIDFVFVDEAHSYKNIRPITRLGNVAGITQQTAKKNMDMEMKIRAIQEEHDNTNVVFATGTPVSNSISEMFTMMNYIQPDVLSEFGVKNFDSWVGAFGIIENSLELSPTGDKYISRKRFTTFANLPELMNIYRVTTDIQMTDDLDLPVPEVVRIAVKDEMTDAQQTYLAELVKRTDKIKSGNVDPSVDNMLKITTEAKKLSLDMRLLNTDKKSYSLSDSNKLMQVVDRVVTIYEKEAKNLGTQMIFSDFGTPSTDRFSIYTELKELLMDRGIPEEEVAFIHDAKNKKQKLQLQRQMNAGEIRVLIASTEKGGTGLNVQRRMKAVHHIDVPWKPSDIIQRNGRIVRQGNIYKQVHIFHYITKGSFDNYLWQIQETKLKYISQIMTSKTPIRASEDIDDSLMTASDFKAIATGNPFLKMKMELDNELKLLESRKQSWKREQQQSRGKVSAAKETLTMLERKLKNIEIDLAQAEATKHFTEEVVENVTDENGVTNEVKKSIEHNPFEMTFEDGTTLDSRTAAGAQIHYLMQQTVSSQPKMVTIATYRGFKLRMIAQKDFWKPGRILTLNIVGAQQYPINIDFQSELGTISRIVNKVDGLESVKKTLLEQQENTNAIITRGVSSDTFVDQARLDYVTAKLDVLNPIVDSDTSAIEKAINNFEEDYAASHATEMVEVATTTESKCVESYEYEESELVEGAFAEKEEEKVEAEADTLSQAEMDDLFDFLEEVEALFDELDRQQSLSEDIQTTQNEAQSEAELEFVSGNASGQLSLF